MLSTFEYFLAQLAHDARSLSDAGLSILIEETANNPKFEGAHRDAVEERLMREMTCN